MKHQVVHLFKKYEITLITYVLSTIMHRCQLSQRRNCSLTVVMTMEDDIVIVIDVIGIFKIDCTPIDVNLPFRYSVIGKF